jgi:hypothetical protein
MSPDDPSFREWRGLWIVYVGKGLILLTDRLRIDC